MEGQAERDQAKWYQAVGAIWCRPIRLPSLSVITA
jgi:hypothetical protein